MGQQKRQRRPSGSIMSVGIILSLVFPGISNALINEDKSKDARLGNCPIIEGCNQDPSYANENLDPGFRNFADGSFGCDGDWCKKEVKDPKLDGGNQVAVEEDDLPCSTPLTGYNQDDPILVSLVARCHIVEREPSTTSYNFSMTEPFLRGQVDQPVLVDLIYNKSLQGGLFIEAGAWDGEALSNSLFFELERRWTGLLVEPNSAAFRKLRLKHRKTSSSSACLSLLPRPTLSRLTDDGVLGGLMEEGDGQQVLCLPLYTLLLAMGNPTVHYLSLDIEGGEMSVLRTIPWHNVDIWLLSVETNHGATLSPDLRWSRQELVEFMESQGYRWIGTAGIDELFCRPDKVSVPESLVLYIQQQRLPNFFPSSEKESLHRDNAQGRPITS